MSRCIDADAFINRIVFHTDFETDVKELFEDEINAEPTIEPRCETCEAFNKTRLLIPQPERKKGKWLPDNNSLYEMRFVCSECHESEVVPTIGFTKYKPIWDFCPNCGADMREDGEADADVKS